MQRFNRLLLREPVRLFSDKSNGILGKGRGGSFGDLSAQFDIPRPIPLGDPQEQRQFEEDLRAAAHHDNLPLAEEAEEDTTAGIKSKEALQPAQPDEQGGPKGKEPTRYGDWERKGRAFDF